MRVLIIGGGGQVGTDLRDLCRLRGYEVKTFGPRGCDFSGYVGTQDCRQAALNFKPEVVYNCAAMHDVTDCENNHEKAFKVNAFDHNRLIGDLAECVAKIVYVSTDYVFPGSIPTRYTVDMPRRPVNIYGMSKALGEYFTLKDGAGYVARLSYVYGHKPSRQKGASNLIDKLLYQIKQFATDPQVEVTSEMSISLVSSKDAARMLLSLPEMNPGIYHCVNSDFTDLKFLAQTISGLVFPGSNLRVTEKEPQKGRFERPLKTALVPNVETRDWAEALREYLSEKGEVPYFNNKPLADPTSLVAGKISC